MYIVRERAIRESEGGHTGICVWRVGSRKSTAVAAVFHFPDGLLEAEEGALDFLFAYDYRFSTVPTLICRLESEFTDKQVNTVLHRSRTAREHLWRPVLTNRLCYLPKAEAAPGRTRAPADARAAVPTRTTAGFTDSGSQAPTLREATPEQSGHFQFTTGGAAPLFRFRHK